MFAMAQCMVLYWSWRWWWGMPHTQLFPAVPSALLPQQNTTSAGASMLATISHWGNVLQVGKHLRQANKYCSISNGGWGVQGGSALCRARAAVL